MLQKYQNEISPIIYYGISTKINEKDLKIPILQPPDWKSPYWMSLYDTFRKSSGIDDFIGIGTNIINSDIIIVRRRRTYRS